MLTTEGACRMNHPPYEMYPTKSEISNTLHNLLLAEDWCIWIQDGERVRRYNTELWPEWFEVQTEEEMYKGDGPHVVVMLQFCKDNSFKYETRDNGDLITPAQFLAGLF